MHFYMDAKIFMLFVKYSCVPVCKLVAEGKVHGESKGIQYTLQTTFSVVLMLLAYRTLEGVVVVVVGGPLMTCPVKTNNRPGIVCSHHSAV